jgi:hypothetical protein
MDTLGSLGFGALITLAVIWTLGVRVKLDVVSHTVLGALFFVVAAIALGLLGADRMLRKGQWRARHWAPR